tara:strand:+ start:412 stop:636 length:225 start_codon:yes stop_codon:yes gene_type:complete
MKRYITSDTPRVAQTGEYRQYTNNKPIQRAKVTWKMALVARQKLSSIDISSLESSVINHILELQTKAMLAQAKA